MTASQPPLKADAKRRSWTPRVLLALFVVIVGGLFLWDYLNDRRSRAELAAIEAEWDQEGIWRWDEWIDARPKIPDDQNAAKVIDQMMAHKPRNLDTELSEYLFMEVQYFPNSLYHPEQLKFQRERIDRSQKAMELLPLLLNSREAYWPIPKSQEKTPLAAFLPGIQELREVSNLFRYGLEVKLHDRDTVGALVLIRASFKLADAAGPYQTLIARLVQIALVTNNCNGIQRLLAMTEPDDGALAALQDELKRYDTQEAWKKVLMVEAGVASQTFRDIQNSRIDLDAIIRLTGGDIGSGWWDKVREYFAQRNIASPAKQAQFLRMMLRIQRVSLEPWTSQKKVWDALNHELETARSQSKYNLAALFFPAIGKIGLSEMKMTALVRSTHVALAAERFRLKQGRWPASQTDLVPAFLPASLLDPFDDQPIRFKTLEDGLVIYSIGKDNSDDSGHVLESRQDQPKDVGVRLWNPDKRRQPAQPLPEDYINQKKQQEGLKPPDETQEIKG